MKAINKDYQSLPSPKQTWAHSTCTIKELLDAVNDPSITAIEADIVMGFDVNDNTGENDNNIIGTQPIMAHPPLTESDLSFKTFLNIVCNDTHEEKNVIKKHVKLDFKTISTVRPVLELLKSQCTSSPQTTFRKEELKTIYLNADIIHGPGARYESMEISYDEFIKLCLSFLKSNESLKEQFALSLGWKSDCRSYYGYTTNDVQKMKNIIEDNDLLSYCQGVVLAVNARILVKNLIPFEFILHELPQIQLLIWTGTGEPPISQEKINKIYKHFESTGYIHQIGFDCKIAPSFLSGKFYDTAVETVGVFWNAKRFILRHLNYVSSLFIDNEASKNK